MSIQIYKRIIVICVLLYVGVITAFFFLQEKLLFHPLPVINENITHLKKNHPDFQKISFSPVSGIDLHGWFLPRWDDVHKKRMKPLMLYFGGNNEEVSTFFLFAERMPNWSLISFNYRGYGDSTGHPDLDAFSSDALAIFDHLSGMHESIALFGRSLGTGVVTHVAAHRDATGIILLTPYDSIRSIVQDTLPIFPVGSLLTNDIDSTTNAVGIVEPTLLIVAELDTIVPISHAEALQSAGWQGDVTYTLIPNEDHNTIYVQEETWQAIQTFITGILR